MERWGLNADTDGTTFADPLTASNGAETDGNVEKDSSLEHYMIPGHVSAVTPDDVTTPSSKANCDAQSLPRRGSLIVQHDCTSREAANQANLAEQTPSSHGELVIQQRVARIGAESPIAETLSRNLLEMYPRRRTSAPDINPHDITPSQSERQSVNSGCYRRRSSQISSTPPLTLAETPSTDDASMTHRKLSEEVPLHFIGQALSSGTSPYNNSRSSESEPGSTATPFVTDISIPKVISCSLLPLWPDFEDPWTLLVSEVFEVQGVATTLAAAGLFDDAFDLFYIEYKYWQACSEYAQLARSMDNSTRRMVTAAINCARNARLGRREYIAHCILLEIKGLLLAYDFAYNLDMALLNLYLSNLQRSSLNPKSQESKYTALHIAVSCLRQRFEVVLPEIQDREYIFMAISLKEILRDGHDGLPSCYDHSMSRSLELQVADHEHLSNCEEVKKAMRAILDWCKSFVQKHRGTLNKVGARSPIEAQSRRSAAWVLYCSCVFSISSFDTLVQSTELICQVPLCTHGNKALRLDTLLALAVISENLLGSGTEGIGRRLSGSRFGDYLHGEIKALINNWATWGPGFVTAYLSRIDNIPTAPKCPEAMSEAISVLLREYIVAAFRTRESSQRIDRTSLAESALMAYSSIAVSGRRISRNSTAGSFHSSINSIRSSMSWDTKRTLAQMLETGDRLRRPMSLVSTWSRNTSSSTAMSIRSQASNSFAKVSGMPSYLPDVDMTDNPYSAALDNGDLMVIDRIPEEM